MPSPAPIKRIGKFVSEETANATPPRAVPSNLVIMRLDTWSLTVGAWSLTYAVWNI